MQRAKYDEWIADYLVKHPNVRGRCREVCDLMLTNFPELELRGGYSHTTMGCEVHYWLLSPDGEIVDPTVSQYGSLRERDYEDMGTTDAMTLLKRFLVMVI